MSGIKFGMFFVDIGWRKRRERKSNVRKRHWSMTYSNAPSVQRYLLERCPKSISRTNQNSITTIVIKDNTKLRPPTFLYLPLLFGTRKTSL